MDTVDHISATVGIDDSAAPEQNCYQQKKHFRLTLSFKF